LPFFARLGIGEVVVIDRDTRRPEAYRLACLLSTAFRELQLALGDRVLIHRPMLW